MVPDESSGRERLNGDPVISSPKASFDPTVAGSERETARRGGGPCCVYWGCESSADGGLLVAGVDAGVEDEAARLPLKHTHAALVQELEVPDLEGCMESGP